MTYRRYAADRIASTAGVLALGLVAVFLIFRVVPDRHAVGPERFSAWNEYYDGNVVEKFGEFWWELIGRGSLGRDLVTGESLTGPILDATLVTLALVVGSLLFAIAVGAGAALLWIRDRRAEWPLRIGVYLAVALSPILLAFSVGKSGVPIGYCDLVAPKGCGGFGDWAAHMLLPWLCLGLFFAALYARLGRELSRRERTPALIAAGKRLGRDFGVAIGLALFVEVFFRLPGLTPFVLTEGGLTFMLALALGFDLLVNLVGAAIEPEWREG